MRLSHRKSGAVFYLANDDANKAFSIAFKTPPADDTGVFHVLEHSVLCGSDKFPVKEPFVDLLKSSMQTFLNAMTFPDKTLYPVASTNDQDLMNLADVYLDAVLHPAIYHKRAIFEQEGWHYELAADAEADEGDSIAGDLVAATEAEDGQAELVLDGVVYNEMKGALSDANSVLYDELQAALFPDTAYRFEFGGTPRAIPDLTYEQFLDEHARLPAGQQLPHAVRRRGSGPHAGVLGPASTSPPWPTRRPPALPSARQPAGRRSSRTPWRPRRPWWPSTWCATWTRPPRTPARAWATS